MKLDLQLVSEWPKLAWVAILVDGSHEVRVLHGPMVEVSDEWIVEAVWAGDFCEGDFDQTDLVFGSGVRIRGDKVVFVSAGTGGDRLWYSHHQGAYYVSNSLPAVLALADLSLSDDYHRYTADIESVERRGLTGYKRSLPATPSEVCVVYFDNLVYEHGKLTETKKPHQTPRFETYDDYFRFLKHAATGLQANMQAPQRRHAVHSLATVSSGYDAPAAAAVAKLAGCTDAVTIGNSNSVWRGSDSGESVAHHMGLSCRVYKCTPRHYRREATLWATTGLAAGLNFTIFDYPKPLCVLFTGCYGDTVWDRRHHDLADPVGDRDALLGEFRLCEGLFHCMVPWWGIHSAQDINALGAREDMREWSLQTDYDRPVARRLAEEAGAPRNSFGMLKRDTSSNVEFRWPFTREAQANYRTYLRERGFTAPGSVSVWTLRRLALFEKLTRKNLLRKLGFKKRVRPWNNLAASRLAFQWANHELKRTYQEGLGDPGQSQSRGMNRDAACAENSESAKPTPRAFAE